MSPGAWMAAYAAMPLGWADFAIKRERVRQSRAAPTDVILALVARIY